MAKEDDPNNQNPENKPETSPENKPDEDLAKRVEAAEKAAAEAKKLADDLKAEKAAAEKAAKDAKAEAEKANKSLEDRLADLEAQRQKDKEEHEAQRKAAEKKALVSDVRIKLGFTDAVYNDVPINGDTEEDITASFKNFDEKLKTHLKAMGFDPEKAPKKTAGNPTNAANPKTQAEDDNIPTSIRLFGDPASRVGYRAQ